MLPHYAFLALVSVVAAAPAEHNDAVVRALKAAPGGSKFCASLLHIPTATITATKLKTATKTIPHEMTTTVTNIVLKTETETITSTVTIPPPPQDECQRKRDLSAPEDARGFEKRSQKTTPGKGSAPPNPCASAPIDGYKCNVISSACSCLGLTKPTKTITVTKTTNITRSKGITKTSTIDVMATTTTTSTTTTTTGLGCQI